MRKAPFAVVTHCCLNIVGRIAYFIAFGAISYFEDDAILLSAVFQVVR
jgi:hypothetical protein